MVERRINSSFCVKSLTLVTVFLLTSCGQVWWAESPLDPQSCNYHAYINNGVLEHISRRFQPDSPVRIGIIPFSVPANTAAQGPDLPSMGSQLAWGIHAELAQAAVLPIVEVMNRQDWPGKKEEFFTGNFGAISMAREAGYDLVLVGVVEPLRSTDQMVAYSKLIETESGITVWYGQTIARSTQNSDNRLMARLGFSDRRPDKIYTNEIVSHLATCVADSVLSEPQ